MTERTLQWVGAQLADGEHLTAEAPLVGGWTSRMRRLTTSHGRSLVLRSFTDAFFLRHADGLLTREADVLTLLAGTDVPAARLLAVDARADHCDHPSLLMTLLPGAVCLDDTGAAARAGALAAQLVRIHGLAVAGADRPRPYQAWTAPGRVRVPERTGRPELWRRAIAAIDREPPAHRGRFLHRDYHPGNVLFAAGAVSGVVDWVETSWGPADLDVAHCATALALLHGPAAGLAFPARYTACGGTLSPTPAARRYWSVLDALGYAPDAGKVAAPWRALGRADLTSVVLQERLETYLEGLLGLPDR
ncbi:phosphotransferase family protein [Streptomyces sp. NPDC059853]|uniref:phosphotransferase family protein n=1 Tax=Streptomyces sp. NPDC059853 TaxID=3346973 RepID=UPI00364B45EA